MSVWLSSSLLCVAAATLTAQAPQPIPRAETGTQPLPAPVSADSWSEAKSRDLFTACDGDSDDRLDLFEAADALDSIADAKDSEAFLRLDADRSGFLSWPEFDDHLWTVVSRGGTFHVRPCRRFVERAPERQEAREATPLQRFLRLHDENGDGGLDSPEIERLVVRAELPPSLAGKLRALDHDRSGTVDEPELAPWFELLRGIVPEARITPPAPAGGLPPPWRAGDLDANGRIDEAELTAVLRRLDAGLARWAAVLLRKLDRDKDGALGVDELPTVERNRRHPASSTAHRDAPRSPAAASLSQAGG